MLLLLLTAAYALGLVLLFIKASGFPLILFSYMADGTLGVVAGFGTRLLLSKRHWLIRSITTTLLPITGLVILGYFTDWKVGIDVIALSQGFVSWEDLIHLVLSISASWAALWAWYRPSALEMENSTYVDPIGSSVNHSSRIRVPRNWTLRPRLRINSRTHSHSGNGSRPPVSARLKIITRQPPRPKRSARSMLRRPHVHLAVVEEHRCPYCLEPVKRTDPGGVKECEVCHTLHHADCWAITGVCQVPHLNT